MTARGVITRLHALVHPHHHTRADHPHHDGAGHRHDDEFDQRRSESYDRMARGVFRGVYRRLAADVATLAGADAVLLDVGTGPGRLLHALAERRADLVLRGVDLSPDMVAVATRVAARAGLADRISVAVADVAALPDADASVDVVVSTFSAHHWAALDAAVADLARVLRPGGRLVIYDFRGDALRRLHAALAARPEFTPPTVQRPRHGSWGWFSLVPFARLTTTRRVTPDGR